MRRVHLQDSRFYPVLYAVVSLALVGFIMGAYSESRISDFRHDKAAMATGAARGAAREIYSYLDELRGSVRLFTGEYHTLIDHLASHPQDADSYARLVEKLHRYFPDYVSFAIVGPDGNILVNAVDQPLAKECVAVIGRYAQSGTTPEIAIHAVPGSYHFDMMVPWLRAQGEASGLFFLSLRAAPLQHILNRASITEYELYLVRGGAPYFVEVVTEGDTAKYAEGELIDSQATAPHPVSLSAMIPGTHWSVAAVLNGDSLRADEREVWRFTLISYGLFVLLTAFLTTFLIHQLGLRRQIENSLRTIAAGVGSTTGTAFFESLSQNLAIALGLRYAMVAGLASTDAREVSVLSIWDSAGEVERKTIELDGSVLQHTFDQGGCDLAKKAAQIFPTDCFVKELGVEAFICVPLLDSQETRVGVLCVMNDKPIHALARIRAIVEIMAARAGAEIERLRVQQALVRSEAQYRYLVETSRDILWELDVDGRWVYVNNAAKSIYGYEPQEMIGSLFRDLTSPQYADRCSEAFGKILRVGELKDYEVTHRHKSGRTVHLIYNGKVKHAQDGVVIGMTGTATDVTDLMKAQAEAKKNSGLFSAVLSNLPVFFFCIDEQGMISDIRGNGLQGLGAQDYGLVGESIFALFSGARDEIDRALSGKMVQFEVQGLHEDKLWWFSVSLFFDAWRGKGAVGFAVDVTGRKTAEVKMIGLVRENRALARRLIEVQEDERTILSRELHDELGQSITAVKSLATAITHLDEDRLSEIKSLGNSIIDLSARLYDFAKNLMHRLRPDVVDTLGFREAIDTCLKRSQLEASGVTCGLHTTGDLDTLNEILKITTYRIIQECLTNILKYAMASNVQIIIKRCSVPRDEQRAASRWFAEDRMPRSGDASGVVYRDTLILHISDDGVGMDIRARVDQECQTSTGVGLQGIRERVTALGGELEIVSAAGKGVQLTVTIDIGEADYCSIAEKDTYNEALAGEEVRHETNQNIVS